MQVGKMEGKSDLRDRIMFYENEFDLVLLAERFDESLVVMKDVLCWDTQDIKYLKVRQYFNRNIYIELCTCLLITNMYLINHQTLKNISFFIFPIFSYNSE